MSQDMNNGTTPPAALDTAEKKGKGRPKFFSTLGKKEETSEEVTADPAAARLARAIRGKVTPTAKTGEKRQSQQEIQAPAKATAPARSASGRPAAQPARRGGFKPRHLIGILLYLIVADVAGLYEKQLLVNSHIEKLLFNLGPIPVYLSTVMFLLTLVLLLIVLARFDLVPRSLSPSTSRTGPASKGQSKASPRDNNDNGQPGMKQGVKGADDDLYQEYRQNQRYWQRRDRKK